MPEKGVERKVGVGNCGGCLRFFYFFFFVGGTPGSTQRHSWQARDPKGCQESIWEVGSIEYKANALSSLLLPI